MKNQLKTVLLITVLSAMVIGIGSYVAPSLSYVFVGIAIAMNIGAYFYSDKIVLRMHGAKEIEPHREPDLHAMVEELARRADIPKPRVFIIADRQANAFATGRNPEHGVVAVTDGILELLSLRELRGVLAHEIAHIKNRDILVSSIAAVMVSVITGIAHTLSMLNLFGSSSDESEEHNGAGGILLALVAPLAATLVQLGISRSREYMADELGARLSGDPEALATALLKLERGSAAIATEQPHPATASMFIVNPFAGAGTVLKLFSTHPSTDDRVARLMSMARGRTAAIAPYGPGARLRDVFE